MQVRGGPPVGVWRKRPGMKYATIDGHNRDDVIDRWFELDAAGDHQARDLLLDPHDRQGIVSLYHEMCERNPRALPPRFISRN